MSVAILSIEGMVTLLDTKMNQRHAKQKVLTEEKVIKDWGVEAM